ncbi:hypothetical protein KGQ64_14000 [bacterium]|nr:hypothetical protein [bacterium]
MANKTTFTPDEWNTIRDAAHLSAMAVTVSGASGIVGTLKETFAMASSLVEGMKSDSELVRSICAKEEVKEAQQSLRAHAQEMQGTEVSAIKSKLQGLAVDRVKAAVAILAAKSPQDLAAYRTFVAGVGRKIAQAASEGGFLGLGGERVSADEKQMLAQLDGALGQA